MTKLAIDISAVIITLSLCLYLSVITFQGLALLIEGLVAKKAPSRISFLCLCQNIGIAAVIGGYTFQTPDLAFAGVLLVASALIGAMATGGAGGVGRSGKAQRTPAYGISAGTGRRGGLA